MSFEMQLARLLAQNEDLVRERNRLLRERSKLRATLRYLIAYIESRNPAAVVGHRIKLLAKARRQ